MNQKSQLGQLGEDIACEYLADKGYKILDRNVRQPWGELDIVAKSKDGTLVFVEVKTMQAYGRHNNNDYDDNNEGIKPEDQLTKAKLRKLQKTASLYAGHYPEKVNDKRGWRIDLVAITIRNLHNSTDWRKNCDVRHHENI